MPTEIYRKNKFKTDAVLKRANQFCSNYINKRNLLIYLQTGGRNEA